MNTDNSRKKPKIIFHLGPPRTGTTWLRNELFAKCNGLKYFGKFAQINILRDLEISLIKDSDEKFLERETALKQSLASFGWSKEVTNVVSNEGLLFPGQFLKNDVVRTVERFVKLLDAVRADLDVSILLCDRPPGQALHSHWSHFYIIYSLIDPKLRHRNAFDEKSLQKTYWGAQILKSVNIDWVVAAFEQREIRVITYSFLAFKNDPMQLSLNLLNLMEVPQPECQLMNLEREPVNQSDSRRGTRGRVSWMQTFKTSVAYIRMQQNKPKGLMRATSVMVMWALQKFSL